MKLLSLLFAAALLPISALADGIPLADLHQFKDGEPVVVQPDLAYVLVRSFDTAGGGLHGTTMFAPILVRTLSAGELQAAKDLAANDPDHWAKLVESNVVEPFADHPYARKDGEAFMIVAMKPGTYVLDGIGVTNWATTSTGLLATTLCLGTVKFDAKPGVVTDLGAILVIDDDKPTSIPELTNVVAGKGRGFGPVPQTVAIRPASVAMELPDALKTLPLVPADYRAVAAYPNYSGGRISRVAPLAGVLDYDKDGRIIDLRAGSTH